MGLGRVESFNVIINDRIDRRRTSVVDFDDFSVVVQLLARSPQQQDVAGSTPVAGYTTPRTNAYSSLSGARQAVHHQLPWRGYWHSIYE